MSLFNPKDKRKTRKEVLLDYCDEHFRKQKQQEKLYKSRPNQILIRDGKGQYKIVSKNYHLYHMEDDEYDTEEELLDEEFEKEKLRIKMKYNEKI